ncbi:flavin reductase family protein [Paraburkholderia sp. 1N]|jgi:flavin reductase (DIM6/NTAB) family NADH-FMN oxidoreductase RutF|uniref:Flavin reductase family protein n=1 Tax=Paraburkholderia solitsugae TaxID=2675748 RepID=A0ABX2C5A2_9BURK|nr:flavin reductase family protein [Paraburkholderia solitsugae]NPT47260.1 flavin reductase family protein [Paraburkholderia solitsugae]
MSHLSYEAVDLLKFSEESRYKFLTGSVVPRPIALVTSLNAEGVLNAAPFSQFVILSVTPPLLGIVAQTTPTGYKDTVRNVLQSGQYVINVVSEEMAEQVQQCAIDYPSSVSEVEEVGFSTSPSVTVLPKRISESPLQFECRLHQQVEFGAPGSETTLLVGEVMLVHCAPGVLEGHRVNHEALRPLGRIAGRSYCRTGDTLSV